MKSIGKARFEGKSGKPYTFDIYNLDDELDSNPAVYVVTLRHILSDEKYTHTIVYIGEAEDLKVRFEKHEKWPCFKKNKANALCVLLEDDKQTRLDIETDLRNANDTDCNKQ